MNRLQRRASEANARRLKGLGWNDFEDVTAESFNLPSFQRMSRPPAQVFKNNLFVVQVWPREETEWGGVTMVGIRRGDAAAIHSWQDLYRIKNEIFGAERAALEVYPAVSELVDDANMYWLFLLDEGSHPPFSIRRKA